MANKKNKKIEENIYNKFKINLCMTFKKHKKNQLFSLISRFKILLWARIIIDWLKKEEEG